jgi:hypothetical protein
VRWNLIFGFPGETRADYVKMLAIIPYLEHLQPPIGFGPIRVDRFSPYQMDPERYGVGPLEPLPAYAKIYPSHARLEDLAYSFTSAFDTEFTRDSSLVAELRAALGFWGRRWERADVMPRLWQLPETGTDIVIEDTRACAVRRYHVLRPETVVVFERLRQPTRCDRVDDADLAALAPLIEGHIVIEYEDHLLNLMTNPEKGVALRKLSKQRALSQPTDVRPLAQSAGSLSPILSSECSE